MELKKHSVVHTEKLTYVCDLGDCMNSPNPVAFRWLTSLLDHKEREHGVHTYAAHPVHFHTEVNVYPGRRLVRSLGFERLI